MSDPTTTPPAGRPTIRLAFSEHGGVAIVDGEALTPAELAERLAVAAQHGRMAASALLRLADLQRAVADYVADVSVSWSTLSQALAASTTPRTAAAVALLAACRALAEADQAANIDDYTEEIIEPVAAVVAALRAWEDVR